MLPLLFKKNSNMDKYSWITFIIFFNDITLKITNNSFIVETSKRDLCFPFTTQ